MVRRLSGRCAVLYVSLLLLGVSPFVGSAVFGQAPRNRAASPRPPAPPKSKAAAKVALLKFGALSNKASVKPASKSPAKVAVKPAPKSPPKAPVKPVAKVASGAGAKPGVKPGVKPPAPPAQPVMPPDNLQATAVEIVAAGKGRINYDAGIVKAIGMGAIARPTIKKSRAQDVLDAREAAVADALRNLSMAISRVRVTSSTRVENYILKSDEIRVRIDTIIRGATVVEEKVLPTSAVYRVVLQVRLTGPDSLLDAIEAAEANARRAAVAEGGVRPDPLMGSVTRPAPSPFSPGMPAPDGAEYTGLIIDCRGLRVVSIPAPKLYDDGGREVYGTIRVSPEYVNEVGIVGYPRSMDAARRSSRAGDRPLVIRALRVSDGSRFHPVISRRDAERARQANESGHFFERTAVIFLVDPI